MKKLLNILAGESYKNRHFSSGYYAIDSAEALLKEAETDPRDYGKGWYLKTLLKLERLLDSLRPGRNDVGRKNFDIYYKREQAVRQKIWQFADTLEPKLQKEIISVMTKLDEESGRLPSGRTPNPKDNVLG